MAGYQTNTYECSICFRRIQNYGLLSNCDDVFCYDCIKQWRTEAISKNKREMFRRCPICNCESPMLIKSKNYVSGEEKKKKFYELKQGKKISQTNQ
jgi:E3 ubiquitin-protein ligase makorin